jgi:phage terminase large subunit-like protein
MRFITASYSKDLALESAEYCRDLIRSTEFQQIYPDIGIKEDKDTKSNFKIVKKSPGLNPLKNGKALVGGSRFSTSVGGTLMGFHGDILIIDDPLNPTQAASEVELGIANRWMEQTLPTRKTNKAVTPTILIMQRLHQDDPAGHLLAKEKANIRHICLPGECRNYKKQVQPPEMIEFYRDDLLDPTRMPWTVLRDMETDLGQYGYAGQIGQDPTPPGGGMFKVDHFQYLTARPKATEIVHTIRAWDKAGTAGGGDYTAGVKMSKLLSGRWLVEDVKRGRWGTAERERIIRETAEADGLHTEVWVEQEPGPIWEEEKVQMADGTKKKLKDIQKGDFVINGEGFSTKVSDVFLQGNRETLKLTMDSGRIIHVTPDHPFFTTAGWKDANQLIVGDVLALKTDIQIDVEEDPSIEECRLAGYFIGDGCCTWTKGKQITPNSNIVCSDPTEGEDIIHCATKLGFGTHVGGSKGWTYYLSNGVRDWLKERSLAGKNTLTKTIPDWVIRTSKEGVANFLGAYMACDGSISSKNPKHASIDFYSTNLGLLQETQSLLLRFGIYTMLRKRNYQDEYQRTRHSCYRLVMRNKDGSMGKFASKIPVYGIKGTKLNFKPLVFEQPYLPDPIMQIESGGELPCRCISVKYGESFLVNDIIVHNSAGKESAESTIRNLAGFVCRAQTATGDKATRADPFSVQVNVGAVSILQGVWVKDYVEEMRFFPFSTHKDQVDSSSLCFSKLVGKKIAQKLIEFCQSKGIVWIGLIAEPGSSQFYTSLGFTTMENHIPMLYKMEK